MNLIGMPEALAIVSLCGVAIAAIINRKPSLSPQSCAACKAEIMNKFSEKREESEAIFSELKKHGEQLARIETFLEISRGNREKVKS